MGRIGVGPEVTPRGGLDAGGRERGDETGDVPRIVHAMVGDDERMTEAEAVGEGADLG